MLFNRKTTITKTKLKRIAWLSTRDKYKVFNNLIHLFNEESLKICFHELSGRKAVGIDRISKVEYGKDLDENISNLVIKMKEMAYIPGPARKVDIPKDSQKGKTRTLKISNFEDKIVQKMMQKILESIYEPIFMKSSYGFRSNIGPHDAIKDLRSYLFNNSIQTVIDVDITKFFDKLNHKILIRMLKMKIDDKKFIRYIIRMLKSGILTKGEVLVSDEGVPQGSPCSPILANVFAHYVIDEWFNNVVKRHCKSKVEHFRYCDDIIICCGTQNDSMRVKKTLESRLGKYDLQMNKDKSKMIPFSKYIFWKHGIKQDTFDFLGFTFYICKINKLTVIKQKTCGQKFRAKLKRVNLWCKTMRNRYKLKIIWRAFSIKLRGHIQYYGISDNFRKVNEFVNKSKKIMFKWLNRRSQKKSFSWKKFEMFQSKYPLPKVKIYHTLYTTSKRLYLEPYA